MSATAIGWIVSIAFIVILVIGFFVGFWRGIRQSTANLVFSVIAAIVAFFVTPSISSSILSINVDNNGTQTSLSQYIIDSITQDESMRVIVERNPNIQILIEGLPSAIANVVVFLIVMVALQILIYIVYRIIACFTFKTPIGLKHHRVWGGVVNLAKVFLLTIFAFMPLASLIGTYNTLQASQTSFLISEDASSQSGIMIDSNGDIIFVDGSQTDENVENEIDEGQEGVVPEESPSGEETEQTPNQENSSLLNEIVPQEVNEIMSGLENNMLIKICGIFGLDDATFDYYSKVDVDNNTIYIRREIENLYPVADFAYQLSKEGDVKITFEELDYDKLENVVNNFTEGGLFRSIVVDLAYDIILNYQEYPFMANINIENYEDILLSIQNSLQANSQNHEIIEDYFVNDIKQVFQAVKVLGQDGLLDEIVSLSDTEQILQLLFADENVDATESAIVKALDTNMVRDAIVPITNFALSLVDAQFDKIAVDTNAWSEEDWSGLGGSIVSIANKYFDLSNSLPENMDIMDVLGDPTLLITDESINLQSVTNTVGNMLDEALSIKLLFNESGESIFKSFLVENNFTLPETSVFDVDGQEVEIQSYTDLFNFITPALISVKDNKIYDMINVSDTNVMITNLATLISQEGKDTILSDIILPLCQIDFTKNILVDKLNSVDTDLISFSGLSGYADWKHDLGYITDILITTNTLKNDEGESYLQLILNGSLSAVLDDITGDNLKQLLKPVLYANSTVKLRDNLFDGMVEVVNALTEQSNQLDLNAVTLIEGNVEDQADEICQVFASFLNLSDVYTEGMTLSEIDKTALGQFMTDMQKNAFRTTLFGKVEEGLFNDMFDNIIGTIKTTYQDVIDLSTDLQTMLEEDNYPYIDFTELFNLIEETQI